MNDIDENVEINDHINKKPASPIDKNGLFDLICFETLKF